MYDAQVLHIPERTQQLDCETSDEAILESLIIVHFDEFVEVHREKLEDAA